jgi:pyruvate formate lyase activating enzyme
VTAAVRGWDLVAGEYGPGTRYVLFTAGCPLRCLYCPTPRAWSERSGPRISVDQVLQQVHRYRPLFDLTGGGVTLSGGEPLLHAAFVTATVGALRGSGTHLALATAGTHGDRVDDDTLAGLDLLLLDLKAHDGEAFRRTTGHHDGPALRFAERVAAQGCPIRVKVVVVPGVTDARANVEGLAEFLAGLGTVEHVDVVPFDRAAQAGWAAVGLDYPLARHPGPTHDTLHAVRTAFGDAGLSVA